MKKSVRYQKKRFKRFLRQNGIEKLFYEEASAFPFPLVSQINKDLSSKKSVEIISRYFVWDETKEGFLFWRNINIKWLKFK